MSEFLTIVMAAGEGSRMKSDIPKVLHKANGKALIDWVLKTVGEEKPTVIVGHKKDQVMEYIGDRAQFVVQKEQKGTGHAVMMAEAQLQQHRDGYVVILAGDMPLIERETVEQMKELAKSGCDAVLMTAEVDNPFGYGRILHDSKGNVTGIVEEKDATNEQREIKEINASVYCIKIAPLLGCLDQLSCNNAAGEYYLTDCIKHISKQGGKVKAYKTNYEQCLGVNTKVQLAQASEVLRWRINQEHMTNGVMIIDPKTTYIEDGVEIGRDTEIYPGNSIGSGCRIGSRCEILPNNRLEKSIIGDDTKVESSVLLEAKVGSGATVGPYAYLRPNSEVGDHCRIGDFVEIKNSTIGDNSKVSHLSYVGDSDVGQGVNIGCGVVFVNYDGLEKHRSVVEDDCFIGCNTNLISPVHVGKGAYTAAGTTVTKDVPEKALAIGRSRQTTIDNWVSKRGANK